MEDDYGIETISYEKGKKDPLDEIPTVEANAANKKPSLMKKVEGKISELKGKYSSYQAMQKQKAKEKAMKQLANAKEERELRTLERDAAKESALNKKIKEETKTLQKKSGGGNPLAALGAGIRSYSASRKAALYGGNTSKSSLLSGGLGSGSGLLGQGLGKKSGLLSGGLGGKNKLLSGGLGGKSRMSLTLGKGRGLRL
jgi:hypothetical protein